MVNTPENPLRVAHVIASVSPKCGGPTFAVLEIVRHLREAGVEAEVITTNDDGPDKFDCPLGERTLHQGLPMWFFDRFSTPVLPARKFYHSSGLYRWSKQHLPDFDVVHLHGIFTSALTATTTLARRLGVPYIVRPQGHLDPWSLRQKQLKKNLHLRIVGRKNLNHAALIHCTSPQEAASVAGLGLRAPTRVIPHGITPGPEIPGARARLRESLGLPPDRPVFLFLSRWHRKKGLEHLLPAVAALRDQPCTLVLAGGGTGDPDYEASIHELIKSEGLNGNVITPGFLSGEEKNLFLQGSDLFVLTSQAENFAVALLEAAASGLPALVTGEVALSDFVKESDAGYVVPLETGAIRDTLSRFMAEREEWTPARKEKFKTAARARFSWEANAATLKEIYQNIARPA